MFLFFQDSFIHTSLYILNQASVADTVANRCSILAQSRHNCGEAVDYEKTAGCKTQQAASPAVDATDTCTEDRGSSLPTWLRNSSE